MSSYDSYSDDYSDDDYSPDYSDHYDDPVSDRSLPHSLDDRGSSKNDVTHSSEESDVREDNSVPSPINLPIDSPIIYGAQALTSQLEEKGSSTNDVTQSFDEGEEKDTSGISPIPTDSNIIDGEEVKSEEGSYYSGSEEGSYYTETEPEEEECDEKKCFGRMKLQSSTTSASPHMGNRIQQCECLKNLGNVKEKLFGNRVYEIFRTLHLLTPDLCPLVIKEEKDVSNNPYGLPNSFWVEFVEENKKRQRKHRSRPQKKKIPIENLSLGEKTIPSSSTSQKGENWSKWLLEVKSVMQPTVTPGTETKP